MFKKTKRSYERIKAHFLVKYTLPDGKWRVSFCRNLSASGALIYSAAADAAAGDEVALKINVPGRGEPARVKGRVVRVVKMRGLPGYETAVSFTEIDPETAGFLHKKAGNR